MTFFGLFYPYHQVQRRDFAVILKKKNNRIFFNRLIPDNTRKLDKASEREKETGICAFRHGIPLRFVEHKICWS